MNARSFFAILACLAFTAFWSTVPVGCATIIPPEGGPKDTIPPMLLKAEPGDSTTNFQGRTIRFTFNEYIDVKNPENIIYTPEFAPGRKPRIEWINREITLKLQDSLLPNTTYVFNFGNSIVDMNESNPIRDFTYAFSTGSYLDSLEISGRVVQAESGGIDSNMIVMLFRNQDDSAVIKSNPQYVTRLGSDGSFRFRYLPSDTFAIYALGTQPSTRQYRDSTQLFAFSDVPVVAGETDSITLFAYREATKGAAAGPNVPGTRIPFNDRRLRFNAPGEGQLQDLMQDYVITFPVPLRRFDSTRVRLTADSTFSPTTYSLLLDSSRRELRVRTAWKEETRYNLELDQAFAADTANRQLLKGDTLFFTTRKASDYGAVSLRLRGLDLSRRPVLQFLLNGAVVQSVPVPSGVFTSNRFAPGEYELRIVYDTNGNGKWDPGSFRLRRQPEPVRPVEGRITVKGNWDNEFERTVQ